MANRIIKKFSSLGLVSLLGLTIAGCGGSSNDGTQFTVRIANIGADAISTSQGNTVPAVLAPGAAIVNFPGVSGLFTVGQTATPGLEIMAEDGGGMLLASEASEVEGVNQTVTFGVPEGADEPGPLTPGNSYVFQVSANPGENLNFATMFVQSNDLFLAPAADGIPLFDAEGQPRSGDITSEVVLWDAGTEVNQEPGVGADQAPRQAGPNTGADEGGVVRNLNSSDFPLPSVESFVTITITPDN